MGEFDDLEEINLAPDHCRDGRIRCAGRYQVPRIKRILGGRRVKPPVTLPKIEARKADLCGND